MALAALHAEQECQTSGPLAAPQCHCHIPSQLSTAKVNECMLHCPLQAGQDQTAVQNRSGPALQAELHTLAQEVSQWYVVHPL